MMNKTKESLHPNWMISSVQKSLLQEDLHSFHASFETPHGTYDLLGLLMHLMDLPKVHKIEYHKDTKKKHHLIGLVNHIIYLFIKLHVNAYLTISRATPT